MDKKLKLERLKEIIRNASNDISASEANRWSENIDRIGRILAIISAVLGAIIAIAYAGATGRYSPGLGVSTFILMVILFGLISISTYIIFHIISIALNVFGDMLKYNRQTAEVQSLMLECMIEGLEDSNNKAETRDSKKGNDEKQADASDSNSEKNDLGYVICPSCGMKYYNHETRCTYCGEQLN